jgi:hypothetical protein
MSALAKGRGTAINRPLDEAATLLFSGFEAEAAEVDRAAGLDARAKVRCSVGAAITLLPAAVVQGEMKPLERGGAVSNLYQRQAPPPQPLPSCDR